MMKKIVVGTTPKIRWKFSNVDVSDIVTATMTIVRYGKKLLTKEIDSAVISDSEIAYSLSQNDTLNIGAGPCEMMLNWVTSDGIRGTSEILRIEATKNHINEVL